MIILNKLKFFTKDQTRDSIGNFLILISSITLGIWATVDTIALRNALLIGGAVVAIYYLFKWPLETKLCHRKAIFSRSNILYLFPILLVASTFLWVIVHYVFFAQYPEKQFQELTSTWFRALMAAILATATAVAFIRNQNSNWLLWLGLIISFLILFLQYIPKAIDNQSFMAYDPFGNYIYYAKFNGVLAGVILIAGTMAFLIDKLLNKEIETKNNLIKSPNIFIFVLLGIFLPFYSFITIFNAKNGVGISIILFAFLALYMTIYFVNNYPSTDKLKLVFKNKNLYILLISFLIVVFASIQHSKISPGWNTLLEDFKISIQIEKYENWKNLSKYGYPQKENGETVTPNTYERVAWAAVGLKLMSEDPLGVGIFRALRIQMEQKGIEFTGGVYTHSGWIDLGLAFGWPGFVLLPLCLLVCLIAAMTNIKRPGAALIISLSVTILISYLVGEYAFQHGIEILIYFCSFVSILFLQFRFDSQSCTRDN